MNKKYVVKQSGLRDCASCCLLSIIRYNNGNVSKSELEYLIKTNEFGTNAYDMIEGMKTLGFNGMGLKKNFNDLFQIENLFPVIAHVKNNSYYHYVVIYKINRKKKCFEVMDPACGMINITYNDFKNIYLNTVLTFKKIKNLISLENKKELLYFIIDSFKCHRKNITIVSLLSIIVTFLSLIINYHMKLNVDYVLEYQKFRYIYLILLLFILIVLLKNILSLLRDKLVRNIEFDINNKINYKVVDHIFRLPYKYFHTRPSGELVSRINDLEYLKNFISSLFLNIFVDIFVILLSFIVLVIINLKLSLLVILLCLIYFLIGFIYKMIYKRVILNNQLSSAEYQTCLLESINAYESINNLNKVNDFINKLDYKYYKTSKSIKHFKKVISYETFFKNIVVDSLIILLCSIGILMIKNNEMTLGDLIFFSSVLSFFILPLRNIIDSLVEYVYSFNSYNRINDFLLVSKNVCKNTKECINGDIEVCNLSYEIDKKVIDNFNLKIKKKDKVFLIGKSGSGKSTLLKIIKRYINDYKGEIYFDDCNLKDIDVGVINNSILYISQNECLFTGTIKENILIDRKISNKNYKKINKITLVDKIIDKKHFRDAELIEENGFNISGGEKQKIILARALHEKFNYLIMDEALSEVDEKDEKQIIENILEEFKDKTIIYVSHKTSVAHLFERVINMEDK